MSSRINYVLLGSLLVSGCSAEGLDERISDGVHEIVPTARFAVIGDYGANTAAEGDVADLVASWNPDFIITTGDNNYEDGAASTIDANIGQYYHAFIHPYMGIYGEGATTNRFFPTLGNHDWHTPNAQPYLDYFTLPGNERYYDFVRGDVHFFAIDSDPREPDGTSSSSVQAAWLQSGLAASTARWQIVYFHHPPYSSGRHGSTTAMQWPFREWGADAVLSGHDHTYERIDKAGFPYMVNGLGGRSRYSFRRPVSGSVVRYNADYGAQLVEADASTIIFKFYNRAGSLIDTLTLGEANGSTTAVFQQGVAPSASYTGTQDSYISQNAPTTSYGSSSELLVDGDGPTGNIRDVSTLIKWDISSIPAGSTVSSATITLNVSNTSTQDYELYQMKRAWVEEQVTWNAYATGSAWQTAGALGSDDRGSTVLGTLTPSARGEVTVELNAAGVALVQQWIASPSSNNGLIIADGGNGNGADFRSSEYSTAGYRPSLVVTYTP